MIDDGMQGFGPNSLIASRRQRHAPRLLLTLAALSLGLALLALPGRAEIIHLKNGRKIVAEIIREDERQIVIMRGGGEFAIPRTVVDRIEKSASPETEAANPAGPSQSDRARDLPLPPPPGEDSSAGSSSPAVKDNAIDSAYLQQLDQEVSQKPTAESLHHLAQGYQQAAIFLTRQGNAEGALDLYRHALRLAPNDVALTLAMGYLLVKQTYYSEALSLLLPAEDRHPEIAAIPMLLGSAYYAQEDLNHAVVEWKKSLALQDDPRLREALAKVEKEQDVSGTYLEVRGEHFLVRYEGRQAEGIVRDLLNTLEVAFRDLSLELDYNPHETIIVLLYPDQAFRDITRSPSWVGALNDGKIRVPVSGLKSVTPELARVLRHELTHSFVRQVTLGRCPTWFNEGLAQLEEGATTAALGSQLARAFVNNKLPAFSALEASFMDLSSEQVGLAYAKSLAGLEYLRDTYGMGEISRLLKALPSSPGLSSLFQDELRLNYAGLDQEVANYIVKRYGASSLPLRSRPMPGISFS